MRRRSRSKRPQPRTPYFDRNHYIKPNTLRVISDTGENLGVISKQEALNIAQEKGLDLVLINPQIEPPVAKIIAWSKFKYDLSKKRKSNKAKRSEIKGMWVKPFIEEGDLVHKISRVEEFISKGNKVKLEIRQAKGKRADREKIKELADRIITMVENFAELEGEIKREGRNTAIFLKPKR